ncbi:MAG: CBS domain-containing protein [Clostridia bacterium]|nr:CBS domain-containing protein [Clostridia bacterium]
MNIAFLLQPKSETAFLYDDYTLRQGLEKMRHHGYTAIPVIDREGHYLTTISEGDFLWFILKDADEEIEEVPLQSLEKTFIRDLMHKDKNPPVPITASAEELIERGMEQNFIPVVDDWGSFIGIITRRNLLETFANYAE